MSETFLQTIPTARTARASDDLVSSLDERGDLRLLARQVDDDYDVWSSQRTAADES